MNHYFIERLKDTLKILPITLEEIETVFEFYTTASKHQQAIKAVAIWPEFERTPIKKEIEEGRQWKIIVNNQVVCIWAITFSDPDIWEERNTDSAIYIHRIATHPNFRGNNCVSEIVKWAKVYAKKENKQYIRLDTVGNNLKLIDYYQKSGFDYLGQFNLKNRENLYGHYKRDAVCLFEIKLGK